MAGPMAEFVEAEEVEEAMHDLEARILNVLPREQFDERHIPHSINVPIDEPGFEETVRRFAPRKDQRIITYCRGLSCDASTRAARRLEEMGYTHVSDYKAGMEGWQAEHRPVEAGQATHRGERLARAEPAAKGTA